MKVLVTGAAGSIGRVVTAGLLDRGHEVHGLDRSAEPEGTAVPWFTVDCGDPDAVAAVFHRLPDLEAVVHLAGIPDEDSLPVELASHVHTTAVLLDAMVASGTRRMVYASSNHAVGRTPRAELADGLLTAEVPPRPDTFYGVAKVAAEALLQLYVDRHGLDAVALRIGSFLERPETVRQLATWLSPDDCVRMVDAALTAPDPGYAVVYGISANTRAWWDHGPGRALGYDPQDDAEAWADQVIAGEETEEAFVGGPFVAASYHRPAL